jgi:adenosylmethionine-8-amino-7-oxononanoate aminotransferase
VVLGLGHGRREIAEAIGKAALQLDYAPPSSSATRPRSSWPTASWH